MAPIFHYEPHLDSTGQNFQEEKKSLPEASDTDDEGSNQSVATRQIQTGGLDDHDFMLSWVEKHFEASSCCSCMEKF